MGLFPVTCPKCNKDFMWFSGNAPFYCCSECLPGDHQEKIKEFNEDQWIIANYEEEQ